MKSTAYRSPFKQDAPLDWLFYSSFGLCILILAVSVCCSLDGLLWYDSLVVVFFDRGHYIHPSTIPVNVVRVKSYVNRLFDPGYVPVSITTNKLYPKRVVHGVVNVF